MLRNTLIGFIALMMVGAPVLAVHPPDTVYELVLTGMTCGGCKREASDILLKIENVKSVEVDWKAGKATMTMKGASTLDRATVDKAFKGTKFSAVSLDVKKAPESKPKG